jgi:hypothetical protein
MNITDICDPLIMPHPLRRVFLYRCLFCICALVSVFVITIYFVVPVALIVVSAARLRRKKLLLPVPVHPYVGFLQDYSTRLVSKNVLPTVSTVFVHVIFVFAVLLF